MSKTSKVDICWPNNGLLSSQPAPIHQNRGKHGIVSKPTTGSYWRLVDIVDIIDIWHCWHLTNNWQLLAHIWLRCKKRAARDASSPLLGKFDAALFCVPTSCVQWQGNSMLQWTVFSEHCAVVVVVVACTGRKFTICNMQCASCTCDSQVVSMLREAPGLTFLAFRPQSSWAPPPFAYLESVNLFPNPPVFDLCDTMAVRAPWEATNILMQSS